MLNMLSKVFIVQNL